MPNSYEIEIKSLLGNKERADKLIAAMREKDAELTSLGSHEQLNHYFIGGNLLLLEQNLFSYLSPPDIDRLKDLAVRARNFSLRTRQADKKVILVLKVSVDDTTSANGTARLEFEAEPPKLSLVALDDLVLRSGFTYQAKWSRERTDFKFGRDVNVCIDKNAGYGYLAEFEMIVDDVDKAGAAKEKLRSLMNDLGVVELPQDRLARMFDHYNTHWQEYYGTEKTFVIE